MVPLAPMHDAYGDGLTMDDHDAVKAIAKEHAYIAGAVREEMTREQASNRGFVEDFRSRLHNATMEALRRRFPNDSIHSYRNLADIVGRSGRIWVITPIDDIYMFLPHQNRPDQTSDDPLKWCVAVACLEQYGNNREVIYGVINGPLDELQVAGGKGIPPEFNGQPLERIDHPRDGRFDVVCDVPADNVHQHITDLVDAGLNPGWVIEGSEGGGGWEVMRVIHKATDAYANQRVPIAVAAAMAAIFPGVGGSHNVDWNRVDLKQHVSLTCGTNPFMAALQDHNNAMRGVETV